MQKVKGGEEERDRSDTTSGCGTGQSSEEGVSDSSFLTYSIFYCGGAPSVPTVFPASAVT